VVASGSRNQIERGRYSRWVWRRTDH